MTTVSTPVSFPLNQWDKKSIRPGPVGSVGDVLTSVRIRQSMPDMDFAYDKKFNPKTDVLRGSNVQDGQWFSFSNHGYNARTKKQKYTRKASSGWIQQDIVPTDRYAEPALLDQPAQGFKSQVASILARQGNMFTPLPGGYSLPQGVLPRGGAFPVQQNLMNAVLPTTGETKMTSVVETQTDIIENLPSTNWGTPKARNKYGLKIDTSNLDVSMPPLTAESMSSASMASQTPKASISFKNPSSGYQTAKESVFSQMPSSVYQTPRGSISSQIPSSVYQTPRGSVSSKYTN